MERPRSGPLFGIAVVLALGSVLLFERAIYAASELEPNWSEVSILCLLGVVAWIFAFNFFVAWLRLRGDGDE